MRVRLFNPTDAKLLHKWYHDPSLQKFFRYLPRLGFSVEQLANAPQLLKSFILMADTDEGIVGMATVATVQHPIKIFKYGVLIDPEFQNKQCAYELSKQAIAWAFDVLNADRLYVEVLEEDTRNRELIVKFGFTQEGVMRKAAFHNGIVQDEYIFGLLKNEFKEMRLL